VKVGLLEGKILSISPRSLTLQIGDKQSLIELGHNLRDGSAAASPSPSGRGPG